MLSTLASVALGLYILMYAVPLFPTLMERLMIRPNRHRPPPTPGNQALTDYPGPYKLSRAGLFTDLQPARVKVKVTWFGTFVTCLMNWQGKHFIGENPTNTYAPDHQGYWKVADSGDCPDSHPLPFPMPKIVWGSLWQMPIPLNDRWLLWLLYSPLSIAFWIWTRYVYKLTGAVWVGIPGFRTLRFFWFDRLVKEVLPDGTTTFRRVADWSDNYRVGHFQVGVIIPAADTKDLVEVKVLLNLICHVVNPYLVAFNTDNDWMGRLLGAIGAGVNVFTRPRSYKEVLAAGTVNDAALAAKTITDHVETALAAIGISVDETQYIDATPTDPEVAAGLSAPAVAEAKAEAEERLAVAHAAPVAEIGKAIETYPWAAHIPALEAQVRTAEAAGDRALIFLGNPGDHKPLDAAQFRELRELKQLTQDNRREGAPS